MKKLFLLLLAVLSIGLSASAQTRTVKGTVVDATTEEPIIGASVQATKGTGVATDIDGNFVIQVPEKTSHLMISYIGYKDQHVAIGKGNISVRLEPSATNLDEVMAVAYGTAKKSSFTGSATVVKSDKIENTQVTNALDALKGKVAGVQMTNATGQPGSTPSILIRGITSINAGTAPLYVVDGVPFAGDINTINTHDIESMTVLKDAASNALYGARGANGVILITTKRGKSDSGAIVNFDAKWGCNSRASKLYETIDNPGQYYETVYGALYNYATRSAEQYGGLGLSADDAYLWANANLTASNSFGLGYNVYNVPEGQTLIGRNGKLNPNASLGNKVTYDGQEYFLTPDNWLDLTYRNSLRQEYNFSVTSGNEKSSIFASFGYLNNKGITPNSDYERLTGRLKAELQAKSWLKLGANMSYSHYEYDNTSEDGTSNSTANIFAAATQVAPIYPMYVRDGNGNIMIDSNGFQIYDFGKGQNAGMKRPQFYDSNPMAETLLNVNHNEGNAFSALGFAEIRFLKDFKFTSNNSVSVDEYRSTETLNPYYGQYATQNGIVYKGHSRYLEYAFQQLLTWSHQFGAHNVSVLAGHENSWQRSYSLTGAKHNMFDPNNTELVGAISVDSASSSTSEYNNEGWIFRGQYDYDGKYFASGSFRRDGSSRFHPDHRWGNFWSLGAAWIISKENFFNANWVDQLKFKVSYGEQGNDRIGNYLYTNTYTIVNAGDKPAAVPNMMGNPEISWEKGGNFNVGFDFSLWNGRLSGSIEGFYRKTTDMLSQFYLPTSFGFSGYYDNIGDMQNGGIEVDLLGNLITTKDFRWDLNVNLTYYQNKVTFIADDNKSETLRKVGVEGYTSGNFIYAEGKPLFTYFIPKYAGVDPVTGLSSWYRREIGEDGNFTGNLTTTTNYSDLTTYDYFDCGSALPHINGGFGTSLAYRDFDFSIDFSYQIGGQCYDSGYAGLMSNPYDNNSMGHAIHKDMLNAWSETNLTSDTPRWQWGDDRSASTSDRFLTDASYLSLNNINVGYSLPRSIISKLRLQKVRVYFAADNVTYWSKRKGMDPRQSVAGGVNNTYYSPVRTLSGGINVTF